MEIGRFYLKRGAWLAAINRFKKVVEEYQTTSHVPEALHRMTEAYLALGLKEQAYRVAAVLGHNYPGSEWYMASSALLEGKDVRPPEDRPGMLIPPRNSPFSSGHAEGPGHTRSEMVRVWTKCFNTGVYRESQS